MTVYAFAIDNFNRPQDEVDSLLDLARAKLLELSAKGNILDHYGVRINVIGRKDLLPISLQEAICHVERNTENNRRWAHCATLPQTKLRRHCSGTLNVMCPYASREEMTSAVQDAVEDVQAGVMATS